MPEFNPKNPEQAAAFEAAKVVAPRFQLDPMAIMLPSTRHAVVGARRVTWLILKNVLGWNVNRISDVFGFTYQAVWNGIEIAERAKPKTDLAKIRDACLAEAAGAGT